jgi:hypothetical protein
MKGVQKSSGLKVFMEISISGLLESNPNMKKREWAIELVI